MAKVSAFGVLVDVEVAPQTFSTGDFTAEVVAISDSATSTMADVRPTIEQGFATQRGIKDLQTTISAKASRLSEMLSTLSTYDVGQTRRTQTAQQDMALSLWERGMREQVTRLSYQLLTTSEGARVLADGSDATTHTVAAGDTLQSIARRYLGDFSLWRKIAEHNGLQPGPLTIGAVLKVPNV